MQASKPRMATSYSYDAQAMQASKPRMATSYSHDAPFRAQTYPQYAPQPPQAQFGQHSPGGLIPSYGGGPNPGYTPPFQSNPHVPSAVTGVPQQPVYNVTNVYNTVAQAAQQQLQPEQQQQQSTLEKYKPVFSLLGGALKLADNVWGQNDLNNFNNNNWNGF